MHSIKSRYYALQMHNIKFYLRFSFLLSPQHTAVQINPLTTRVHIMHKYLSIYLALIALSASLDAAPRPHFESTFSVGSVNYYQGENADALGYEIGDAPEYDANGSIFLDINGRYKQFYFDTRNAFVSSKDETVEFDGEVFEAYYTHSVAVGDISLGRKGTSYGAGQGFKPLALFQGDSSSSLLDDNEVGSDVITYEHFGLESSWAVLATSHSALNDEAELGWRWYGFLGNNDVFLVLSANEDDGARAGAGLVAVPGDSLKLYGEALWLDQYSKSLTSLTPDNAIAETNPFADSNFSSGWRALAGLDYTFAEKWHLIGEAWFDALAYSDDEWDNLLDVRAAQLDLYNAGQIDASIASGNLQWNRQALSSEGSLRQVNTLLRLNASLENWEPTLELLYLPADSGYIATGRAELEIGASNEIEFALRRFGGPENSVPRLLEQSWEAGLHWRIWL